MVALRGGEAEAKWWQLAGMRRWKVAGNLVDLQGEFLVTDTQIHFIIPNDFLCLEDLSFQIDQLDRAIYSAFPRQEDILTFPED